MLTLRISLQVDVGYNQISGKAALNLISIFKEKDQMVSVGLAGCDLGVDGAKAVADYVSVSASLTKISLAENNLAEEGTKVICDVVKGNTTLKELNLAGGFTSGTNIGGPAGAKHVADMLGVNASLTKVECACPQNEPT